MRILALLMILFISVIVVAQHTVPENPPTTQTTSTPAAPSTTSQPSAPSSTQPIPKAISIQKLKEGAEYSTVIDYIDLKGSDENEYRVGQIIKTYKVANGKGVPTEYIIREPYGAEEDGKDIGRIIGGEKYQTWDSNKNEWVDTNYAGLEKAIKDSHKAQLVSQGVSESDAEKIADKESKRQAKKAKASAASDGLIDLHGWKAIGAVMRAYDKYKGIGEFFVLAWPEYGEWSREWRSQISQTFCGFVSIQNCFESLICGAVLDISAGDSISGNVLFGRGPNGQPLTAGTISAERSLPIVLKGLERERLREIVGENVELIVMGGDVINISEVDTTTLPAAEFRLYKVQYSLTNTNDREMKYNLEFKGQATRKFFSSDKKLNPGQTVDSDDRNIEVYSATKYDEVCMTFNPSLPAGTGSTLIVAPKMVNKLCKQIAEYAGGATSIGNYAKKADEEKKQGAPSGGFI